MAQVWVPKPTKVQGMPADLEKTPDVAIAFDRCNKELGSCILRQRLSRERVWTPISNKVLQTRREPENPTDKYAVCVLKDAKWLDI